MAGALAVLQVPIFERLSFDPFSSLDHGGRPTEVCIGRHHVVQVPALTLVVVVLDECFDLLFEAAGQEAVLQQDTVLARLVPEFELACDVAGTISAEQAQPVQHIDTAAAPLNDLLLDIVSDTVPARLGADDRLVSASGPPLR